jgi:hypothetical protein
MVEQNEISAVPGDNIIELATSNFTSGTYFVIIEAGDKLLYKTTFMVQ